ncbi:MAG: hypothetical protein ACI35O_09490 [Bacillaceae bacterium]
MSNSMHYPNGTHQAFRTSSPAGNAQFIPPYYQQYQYMKQPVLSLVNPWVQFGVNEAQRSSLEHAFTEVASISYLMGKGFDQTTAHLIVESWISMNP